MGQLVTLPYVPNLIVEA